MALSTVTQSVGVCDERSRLLDQYSNATQEYYRAIMLELDHFGAVLPADDYLNLRNGVDQARRIADQVRRALQQHISEHRCGLALISSESK